jgi:hypothetical protein
MKKSNIHTTTAETWLEMLLNAEKKQSYELDDEMRQYLILMLQAHIQDNALCSRHIGKDYLTGLKLKAHHLLQRSGDTSLLLSGITKGKSKKQAFYNVIGKQSYYQLANYEYKKNSNLYTLYNNLGKKFIAITQILSLLFDCQKIKNQDGIILIEYYNYKKTG